MNKKILVTGSSGFIGMHLCESLLKDGYQVFGIDNMNNYYDISLKNNRLKRLLNYKNFHFVNEDISNLKMMEKIFKEYSPSKVVNLAAQAGVRYSLKNPHEYIKSNISGFMNILECCRYQKIEGLIYASSSSVYGGNEKSPFSVSDRVDSPISIYAATKKANELMAHSYSHLYKMNTTGLRFFTVYGPWGRPDMAMFIFADRILKNQKLPLFNKGKMKRDFTYIDDIINGIRASIDKNYLCEVFNLGNNNCEDIMKVVACLEDEIGKKAKIELLGMQAGDVKKTYADIDYSRQKIDYSPKTKIEKGIPLFVDWFKSYHKKRDN
jgi:UDP-glucuronate 4-epimerase